MRARFYPQAGRSVHVSLRFSCEPWRLQITSSAHLRKCEIPRERPVCGSCVGRTSIPDLRKSGMIHRSVSKRSGHSDVSGTLANRVPAQVATDGEVKASLVCITSRKLRGNSGATRRSVLVRHTSRSVPHPIRGPFQLATRETTIPDLRKSGMFHLT